MTDCTHASLPATATSVPLAGHWKLPQGRAVTLRAPTDGVLRAAAGRLWATRTGPHGGTPASSGDEVLEPGASLRLRAGERVVIEAWTRDAPAQFDWDPLPS